MGHDQGYFESGRLITPCTQDRDEARARSRPNPEASLIEKIRHYTRAETWRAIVDYIRFSREARSEELKRSYRAYSAYER